MDERLDSLGPEGETAITDFLNERALAKLICERLGGCVNQGICKEHIVCDDTSVRKKRKKWENK